MPEPVIEQLVAPTATEHQYIDGIVDPIDATPADEQLDFFLDLMIENEGNWEVLDNETRDLIRAGEVYIDTDGFLGIRFNHLKAYDVLDGGAMRGIQNFIELLNLSAIPEVLTPEDPDKDSQCPLTKPVMLGGLEYSPRENRLSMGQSANTLIYWMIHGYPTHLRPISIHYATSYILLKELLKRERTAQSMRVAKWALSSLAGLLVVYDDRYLLTSLRDNAFRHLHGGADGEYEAARRAWDQEIGLLLPDHNLAILTNSLEEGTQEYVNKAKVIQRGRYLVSNRSEYPDSLSPEVVQARTSELLEEKLARAIEKLDRGEELTREDVEADLSRITIEIVSRRKSLLTFMQKRAEQRDLNDAYGFTFVIKGLPEDIPERHRRVLTGLLIEDVLHQVFEDRSIPCRAGDLISHLHNLRVNENLYLTERKDNEDYQTVSCLANLWPLNKAVEIRVADEESYERQRLSHPWFKAYFWHLHRIGLNPELIRLVARIAQGFRSQRRGLGSRAETEEIFRIREQLLEALGRTGRSGTILVRGERESIWIELNDGQSDAPRSTNYAVAREYARQALPRSYYDHCVAQSIRRDGHRFYRTATIDSYRSSKHPSFHYEILHRGVRRRREPAPAHTHMERILLCVERQGALYPALTPTSLADRLYFEYLDDIVEPVVKLDRYRPITLLELLEGQVFFTTKDEVEEWMYRLKNMQQEMLLTPTRQPPLEYQQLMDDLRRRLTLGAALSCMQNRNAYRSPTLVQSTRRELVHLALDERETFVALIRELSRLLAAEIPASGMTHFFPRVARKDSYTKMRYLFLLSRYAASMNWTSEEEVFFLGELCRRFNTSWVPQSRSMFWSGLAEELCRPVYTEELSRLRPRRNTRDKNRLVRRLLAIADSRVDMNIVIDQYLAQMERAGRGSPGTFSPTETRLNELRAFMRECSDQAWLADEELVDEPTFREICSLVEFDVVGGVPRQENVKALVLAIERKKRTAGIQDAVMIRKYNRRMRDLKQQPLS